MKLAGVVVWLLLGLAAYQWARALVGCRYSEPWAAVQFALAGPVALLVTAVSAVELRKWR